MIKFFKHSSLFEFAQNISVKVIMSIGLHLVHSFFGKVFIGVGPGAFGSKCLKLFIMPG